MTDTTRAALILGIGLPALVIAVIAVTRSVRWALVNLLVTLTMRPGVRYSGRRWDIVRGYVMDRDGHECQDCGASYRLLHVHHKRPVSEGGSHYPHNLETLCHRCHTKRHPHMR